MVQQTFKNHTRFDPLFHFVVLPALLVNMLIAGYVAIHTAGASHLLTLWWIAMGTVLIVMAGALRSAALRVQDRVIRLEERMRLASLLSPVDLEEVESLSLRQLIALRFAADAELPALALRAVREHLDSKTIKQSILKWRPDEHRA